MAARHKKKASGGMIADAGGNPYVKEEAHEKKKGGRAKHSIGKMHGGMSKRRLDKPGRKAGGRVGADKSPLSSAHSHSSADSEPKSQTGGMSPD